jgi:hypothetical protein
VTATIGEACGSTAWVTALINVCNRCARASSILAREQVRRDQGHDRAALTERDVAPSQRRALV